MLIYNIKFYKSLNVSNMCFWGIKEGRINGKRKKTGRDKLLRIIHSLRTQWQWLMIALILLFFISKRRLISIQIDKARKSSLWKWKHGILFLHLIFNFKGDGILVLVIFLLENSNLWPKVEVKMKILFLISFSLLEAFILKTNGMPIVDRMLSVDSSD